VSKKNPLIARALGRQPVDEFADLPIAEDSAFPMPEGTEPVTTESSPESVSTPEEEEALKELDAKLNSPEPIAPRAEMFFVTVDGISPLDLERFVREDEESDAPSYYGVLAQALYLELTTFDRQLVVVLDRDPRAPLAEHGPTFLDLCIKNGLTITRVKQVVSAVREHETPAYYEGVVALDGPMRVDRSGACRDLYRRDRWYRVKRAAQPFDEQAWLTFATSTSKPSKALGVTYGAVLLDTNLSLDAGWIL
jgi:hypothetical protein